VKSRRSCLDMFFVIT